MFFSNQSFGFSFLEQAKRVEGITLMMHPFLKKTLVGAEVLKPRVMDMLKKRKEKEKAAGEDFGADNEIEAVIAESNNKTKTKRE